MCGGGGPRSWAYSPPSPPRRRRPRPRLLCLTAGAEQPPPPYKAAFVPRVLSRTDDVSFRDQPGRAPRGLQRPLVAEGGRARLRAPPSRGGPFPQGLSTAVPVVQGRKSRCLAWRSGIAPQVSRPCHLPSTVPSSSNARARLITSWVSALRALVSMQPQPCSSPALPFPAGSYRHRKYCHLPVRFPSGLEGDLWDRDLSEHASRALLSSTLFSQTQGASNLGKALGSVTEGDRGVCSRGCSLVGLCRISSTHCL